MSASDAHDWSACSPARRSPPGTDGWIHDSFCNEEKKESACERRNSQDHWEIIRWSGVVDLELNGIINQAKKQARCSYIYYLHFFHFRRCNQQIHIGCSASMSLGPGGRTPILTTDPKSVKWDQFCSRLYFVQTDYLLRTMPSASKVISTTSRTSLTESCCCLPVL